MAATAPAKRNGVTWQSRRILAEDAALVTIYGVLVGMIVVAAILSPTFYTPENVSNVLRQAVIPGILVIGQTLVILTAGIDLSVGALFTLINMLSTGLMQGREDLILPVVLLSLALGLLVGFLNGLIITKGRVAPFIVTLGMYSILRGVLLGYSTRPVGGVADPMKQALYYGQLGPAPYPVILFGLLFAGMWFVLKMTAFGRAVYAVGGSPEVARHAGINVNRLILAVYSLCGLLVAVAALIASARMGIGDPLAGEGMELDSITAAVIGGISLFGGRGSLLGALGGVLILALINNIMILVGVSMFYQQMIKGIIVLTAVAIYKQRA